MNEVFDFQNLIERMGKREEKAFEEFYERFGKLMYAIAVPRTTSKFDAEEVVDDALTKVWRMAPKLKVENINPAGWIATLVKRIAIDKYRRNQRMSTDELFIMPYYDKEIDRIIDNDTFMYLIDPLNEREKEILIYNNMEDYTFDEIAEIIGIPSSTVSSSYYRALAKIKQRAKNLEKY